MSYMQRLNTSNSVQTIYATSVILNVLDQQNSLEKISANTDSAHYYYLANILFGGIFSQWLRW